MTNNLKINKYSNSIKKYRAKIGYILTILVFVFIGVHFLFFSHASTPYAQANATSGTLTGSAVISTSSANTPYVNFGLCGYKTGTPAISKVMIIWEENESNSSIIGNSSVPYMNQLANQCGFANNYWAYTHPSLPNYMAITSGAKYNSSPWTSDCNPTSSGCNTANNSIFSQLGTSWKSYAETMPSNCYKSTSGAYAPKHNPATYYTNISSACSTQDVGIPTSTFNSGPLYNDIQSGLTNLTTVSPDLNNDWHDGSASQADNWLKSWMQVITAGPDYQSGRLAVLVLFDEGGGSGDVASNTYATWVSPYTLAGFKSTTFYDNNSVTQTVEQILGKSILNPNQLRNTSTVDQSMVSEFKL